MKNENNNYENWSNFDKKLSNKSSLQMISFVFEDIYEAIAFGFIGDL